MADNTFAQFDPESPYYQGRPEEGAPEAGATPAASPAPAPAPPESSSSNSFAQFDPESPSYVAAPEPVHTSATGALASHAVLGAAPAAAGLYGAGEGASLGAAAGLLLAGPPGAAVGGIVGGVAGAFGLSFGVAKAQNYMVENLPDSWKDPLSETLATQEFQHPTASFAGGLFPVIATMSPGSALKGQLGERLFSGAIMGAQQLGTDAISNDPMDYSNAGYATALGVVFSRPNVLGQRIINAGQNAGLKFGGIVVHGQPAAPHNPTVLEVQDNGGFATDSVLTQQEAPNPSMARDAADLRSAEISLLEPPPAPDVAPLARRMEPDLFSRADELTTQREEFRRQLADLKNPPQEQIDALEAQKADLGKQLPGEGEYQGGKENRRLRANIRDLDRQAQALRDRQAAWAEGKAEETPEMAAIREHLTAADEELRDLGPHMAAAYRRAAEHTGGEFVEPEPHLPPEEAPAAEPAPSPGPEGETPIERLLRTRVEDLQNAPPPDQPPATPKPGILEDVRNQVMDAGRPPEEAEAIARIEHAYYQTLAQDFGTTADKLYEMEKTAIGRNDKRKGYGAFDAVKRTVTLFRNADASTLVHEKGHEYLERMLRLAQRDDAPEEFKARAQKALDWMGLKSADELDYDSLTSRKDKERATKAEEKFAKGFEQYLLAGTAPSRELVSVFSRFKQWLSQLYKTIKGLGAPINEDIKSVFDRMLSSEPERTVIAGEAPTLPRTLADLHELDRHQTEPAEAAPAADRIAAETTRATTELPEEIRNEIEREAERIQTERDAESGGQDGERKGPGPDDAGSGQEPERVGGGEAGGEQSGAVVGSSKRIVREGAGLSGAERPGGRSGPDAQSLAPTPAPVLDTSSGAFVAKAGNIRTENITDVQSFRQAMHDYVEANPESVAHNDATLNDLRTAADAVGLEWQTLDVEALRNTLAELFGGMEKIRVGIQGLRQGMEAQMRTMLDAYKQSNLTGDTSDLIRMKVEMDRAGVMISALSRGQRESARTLGMAFRKVPAGTATAEIAELAKTATGRELYQLKLMAKLGAQLDTTAKQTAFIKAYAQQRSFGRMLLEMWVNNLISGPATHATYIVGNELLLLHDAFLETGTAAVIGKARAAMGREGEYVLPGEVNAKLGAHVGSLPASLQSAGEAARSGITTLLPGEQGKATTPFQGDTGLTFAREMTNDPVTWAEVGSGLYGAMRGGKDGLLAWAALVKAGGVPDAPLISLRQSPLGHIPDIDIKGVTAAPVGSVLRSPGRGVATIHSFFRLNNYSMSINSQAYRKVAFEIQRGETLPQDMDARIAHLRQNPTPEMMEIAHNDATNITLMGQGGTFTKKLSAFMNQSFNVPWLGDTQLLKFMAPFVHIASNVIDQGLIQRTPLGLLSPELRAVVSKGKYGTASPALESALSGPNGNVMQDMAQARMIVGSGLLLTFGSLAAQGLVTGSAPADPKERRNDALLSQPHSVRIGDTWYSMNRLGALGLLMGMSADLYHVAHLASEGEFLKSAAALHHAVVSNILDESFMRGIADFIQATEQPVQYGPRYVQNFLSSFVPFSVGLSQVNRAIDPYSRDARTVIDSMLAKIPFASQNLPPRRDPITGEPIASRETLGPQWMSAIYAKQISNDPVVRALSELNRAPAQVKRTIGNVKLTPQQFDEYAENAGHLLHDGMSRLVNSEIWARMPANERGLNVDKIIKQSHDGAAARIKLRYPDLVAEIDRKKMMRKQGIKETD